MTHSRQQRLGEKVRCKLFAVNVPGAQAYAVIDLEVR